MSTVSKQLNLVGSHVLINGVTGLLGGEILRELCRQRAASVTALVRGTEQESPRERFSSRMARSGGGLVEIGTPVRVHQGDIVLPNWGLSNESLTDVQNSVDTIVHCAADTSFIRESSVADTNVRGTSNLIELAKSFVVRPRIIYISTATNVGCVQHCCVREEHGCRADNEHHNAYTRSKAIAESILLDSGLDVLIIRPTIVLSAGLADRTFACNILWFAPLIYAFDALPVDPSGEIDLISSDFVAQCTVELMRTQRTTPLRRNS